MQFTPGVLSLGLLIIGALLLLFSAGNIGGYVSILIGNNAVRILIGSIGMILIIIGLSGVVREIFFASSPTASIPAETSIPANTSLPPTLAATRQTITDNPTATVVVLSASPSSTAQPQTPTPATTANSEKSDPLTLATSDTMLPASTEMPTSVSVVNSTFVQEATRKCQEEFEDEPVKRNEITDEQVNTWRQIGGTERAEVGRIIYCEIHQTPGMQSFVEGNTIPAKAIITADLGFGWESAYPGALELLIHEGGGWGVFLSLKPFTVQHASDLPNDVGGQFWLVAK